MLAYITSLPCNVNLTFQVLSYKLAILITLVSTDRAQSIAMLDFSSVMTSKVVGFFQEGYENFCPGKTIKRKVWIALSTNEILCVVCYIH